MDRSDDDKTRSFQPVAPGARIAHFEVIRKLGEGGMGEVYLADDSKLQRQVALKFLPTDSLSNIELRTRFTREAQAVAALNHPNVVQVFEVGEHEGRPYFAMESVRGQSLREVIDEGISSPEKMVELVKQIASGLSAAHKAGIIHRDIKPNNIMLTDEGVVKILDFGLARRGMDEEATQTASTIGTVAYMSPEQVTGETMDHRTDLFSLGTLIYEMSTGHRPFDGKYPAETANNIVRSAPAALNEHMANVPFELWHLLSKCLEKRPDLRYQHADELLADLRRLERELQGGGGPDLAGAQTSSIATTTTEEPAITAGTVPALPPLPPRKTLMIMALASLLVVVVLSFWSRPQTMALSQVQISAGEAEQQAREFLDGLEISLYGYRFYTEPSINEFRQRTIRNASMSASDWLLQEAWQPTFRYRTIAASADHQDRYYITSDATGRIDSVRHVMRPDVVPGPISLDSASRLAEQLGNELFGSELAELERRPVVETDVAGRPHREFRWRMADTLAGGFTPTAGVVLDGATLVQAGSSLEIPPVLSRSLAEEQSAGILLTVTIVIVALIFTIFTAVRKKWFGFPPLRLFFALAALLLLIQLTDSGFFWSQYVEGGIGLVAEESIASILLGSAVLGLAAFLLIGVSYSVLRAMRPEAISGVAQAMKLEFPRQVWARSGAVGLTVGALAVIPALLNGLVLLVYKVEIYPFFDNDLMAMLLPRVGHMALQIVGMLTLVVAGLAVILILRRFLRLGNWVWLLLGFMGLAAVLNQGSGPPEVTNLIALITLMDGVIILWCLFKYGLLSGLIASLTATIIEAGCLLLFMPCRTYQVMGAGTLILWLGLLVLCIYTVGLKPPRRTPTPS